MNDLLLTYYGDDFTGSTDALEVLTAAGAKTVLFTEPPTCEMLAQYPDVQAVGLAGIARSLPPTEMEAELRPAFASLHALGARHLHYKVCSTFDSSAKIGSIGKAIDVGCEFNDATVVPVLVANPRLGRYCVFGNLFAQESVAQGGVVYRLDRHPSASRHPVTPMLESDLCRHLAQQTKKQISLFDILKFSLSFDEQRDCFHNLIANGAEVVLCDALSAEQMTRLGGLIDALASDGKTLFSVGSSGMEMALAMHWESTGKLAGRQNWPAATSGGPILVASGSCSPVTNGQIAWALSREFAELALETCVLTDEDCKSYLLQVTAKVVNLINEGKSVIVHTGQLDLGKLDLGAWQTSTSKQLAERNTRSLENQAWCTRRLGAALGQIISSVAKQTSLKRVCLAGGDTSSYATREMGVTALEMICPTMPGAPLCKATAPGRPVDGMQICFKGGQVGREEYFGSLL
jgi:uncharacterized protein YgbK (DUF1537 family)